MMKRIYKDRDWLYQGYVVEERPATELAELAGCHYSTIYYWLRKYDIPVRDQSEARVVVFKDSEKREQRAQSQSDLWEDPEYRRHQMEVRQSREFREKQSQIIREVWQDPEYYERQCEASRELWQDPEYRSKTLSALLARWDDPEYVQAHRDRLDKLWRDPDYRRMMSEKMSGLLKELWQDPEYRQRKAEEMSERVLELWEDPEFQQMQRNKASEQMRERWQDPEWRAKMSQMASDLWGDPEHRQMMSDLIRERWQDPEWREFFSAFMVERWQDPEYRQTLLNYLRDPERRKQHGELMSELWQDPEFADKVTFDRLWKVRTGYRTDIEAITEEALQDLGVDYEFEYQVGRYSVDFYLPEYRIAIECDGVYWHRDREDKDAERDAYLEQRGLIMVHLDGPDIREDIDGLLAERLLPLIGGEMAT
jgi:very-short-patch-repair endonuclease